MRHDVQRHLIIRGGGGVQPKIFGKLDFELVVGQSGPTYGQTFPGVFEVLDPQIWSPKMAKSESGPKPGLLLHYGLISVSSVSEYSVFRNRKKMDRFMPLNELREIAHGTQK